MDWDFSELEETLDDGLWKLMNLQSELSKISLEDILEREGISFSK